MSSVNNSNINATFSNFYNFENKFSKNGNTNSIAQTKTDSFEKTTSAASSVSVSSFVNNSAANIKQNQAKQDKAKLIIGALCATTALILGGIFLHKKLNANKLAEQIQKILPEHIDFTAAKSRDEAVKFGQNVLGIKNYVGFENSDIKVLNWVNEGLVNVNNATKGKAQMPQSVIFDLKDFGEQNLLGENTLAGAVLNVSGISKKLAKEYGENLMFINTKFFRNPVETLKTDIEKAISESVLKRTTNGLELSKYFVEDSVLLDMLKRFEAGGLDFNEQILLRNHLTSYRETIASVIGHPVKTLELICKNSNADEAKKEKVIKKVSNMPYEEQKAWMTRFLKRNLEKMRFIAKTNQSPFSTLYHEMGHLQDKVKRPKASGKFKSPDEYPKELKDWFNDSNNMEIANMISPYAGTGPGEFIAETFATAIRGGKIQDEVKELYLKLNGPSMIFG